MKQQFNGPEKRRFQRAVFSIGDGFIGVFSNDGFTNDSMAASIMNLSAGGLQFILPRDTSPEIGTGDHLILREIRGTTGLRFVSNLELEVKWVMDHQIFEHVGIGCEFLNTSEAIRDQIDQFVASEILFYRTGVYEHQCP
ncbi:MAG: PilZ domain-containing protein [Planctomycetota bacterium]|jgi:c-di-GMP-binding flagellar brake protein YcgR